ncbi:MAG: adenylyl-sulfate kinase, partial [Nitrospira sp.]|nr:adenylyl-sulfate kinase [Nitrospira sp.]
PTCAIRSSLNVAMRAPMRRFVEVYVRCPLAVCIQRDPKGLYAKASRGEAFHVTGVFDPYEEPLHPDMIVDTDQESPDQNLENIVRQLQAMHFM